MLSFLGQIQLQTEYQSFIMQKNKITKSLQVPCSPLNIIYKIIFKAYHPGKRVLPFTFEKQLSAGMTVEAAFVLPLFVFFSVALIMPIEWLDTQRKIQTVMERFCEDLSQYAYVAELRDWNDKNIILEENMVNENLISVFSDFAAELWIKGKTETYTDQIQIKTSQVQGEDEMVCFELSYKEMIPFFSSLTDGVTMNVAAERRCWVGLDGKLKESGRGTEQTERETGMVYVGANMGRYHMYRDCHYISNAYRAVSYQEIENLRTPNGTKISSCSYCIEGELEMENIVYITQNGEHYHSRKDCSAMNVYVRQVPLGEVEYLGLCSYCARRKNESS